jgi:hypothetical protein
MSQPRTIGVRVELSLAELYRANLWVCGRFEPKRVAALLVSIAFLGAMIWKLLSSSENDVLAQLSPVVGWVLFPALLLGVTFGAPYFVMRTQARRNPKILQPSDYSFSERGVEITGTFGKSAVFWTAFDKVRETKEFFLLYILPRRAYPLPKRCFSSDAEISEFRELLRNTYRGKLDLAA